MKKILDLKLDIEFETIENHIIYDIKIESPFTEIAKKGLASKKDFHIFLETPNITTLQKLNSSIKDYDNEKIILLDKKNLINLQHGKIDFKKIKEEKIELDKVNLKDISIDDYRILRLNEEAKLLFSLDCDCVYFKFRYYFYHDRYDQIPSVYKKYDLQELYNRMDEIGFLSDRHGDIRTNVQSIQYDFNEKDYIESWKELEQFDFSKKYMDLFERSIDSSLILMKKNNFDEMLGFDINVFRSQNLNNDRYDTFFTSLMLKLELENNLKLPKDKEKKFKL